MLAEMGKFNEELVKAGVLLAGARGSWRVQRVCASTSRATNGPLSTEGPFTETKELIAGFWMLQVKSLQEAVEWIKRSPFRDGEVEIRQVAEASDFGAEFTPELREQEERMRREIESRG